MELSGAQGRVPEGGIPKKPVETGWRCQRLHARTLAAFHPRLKAVV
jgi:hypothetical protein